MLLDVVGTRDLVGQEGGVPFVAVVLEEVADQSAHRAHLDDVLVLQQDAEVLSVEAVLVDEAEDLAEVPRVVALPRPCHQDLGSVQDRHDVVEVGQRRVVDVVVRLVAPVPPQFVVRQVEHEAVVRQLELVAALVLHDVDQALGLPVVVAQLEVVLEDFDRLEVEQVVAHNQAVRTVVPQKRVLKPLEYLDVEVQLGQALAGFPLEQVVGLSLEVQQFGVDVVVYENLQQLREVHVEVVQS